MSHDATNWAIKQRGIKPALKVVLWNLCDRYHPDNGCFPSQETLAEDCEVPRSTLNVYLGELERLGLILREQRREKGSKRQERTRYFFPFEPDFALKKAENPSPETGHGPDEAESRNGAEPSPENGESRVQNLDSNPVREPVREPVKEKGRVRVDHGDDRSCVPGTAEFRKRLQRFLSGDGYGMGEWPKWADKTTINYIEGHFARLSEADRKAAEGSRDAFLSKCKREGSKVMGAGNYFRDRVWEVLSGRDREAYAELSAARSGTPARPDNWATAYGPLHAAILFRLLCEGPERPEAVPLNGMWLASHLRTAWPRLAAFWQQTDLRGGLTASDRDASLACMMEFVPVGSDMMAAWREEMRRRGLPEIRIRDGMRGLYFPTGGPNGLIDFEAMVREVRGDEHAA
ncbi:helix-turn-helix protein [Rhizobium subbaraonis]|uniref:Helix-turn-helix protein n=1 Tax=Rhizobium subbaraonis TaxID=908946 RepID=A0A285V2X3_9HYPH|nr:helix-turn-helix domain-containing protein [Rhizobium subbaraonis]SOC48297.1 helix-turn-helix protein [Rhizobium subbaraonis]